MKIKSVRIREFKRFTDLLITEIPESAKLVVLVGPNGSGKSSLFEAFNFWQSPSRGINFYSDYHCKVSHVADDNWRVLHDKINVYFHTKDVNPHADNEIAKKAFYFRSAYRHEADFITKGISRVSEILQDANRPEMMISPESRVSDNYNRIVASSIEEIYAPDNKNMTAGQITQRLIGKVQTAMQRVFEDLKLNGPGKPMMGGTFFFEKGMSRNYRYKNLSGGEKAAFDLLLDFVIKKESFNDTVFCFDEPELHMHTRLQSRLLEELYRQLPANCQMWIATHSIGMTRRAMELYRENPNEVVFLNFENQDFDAVAVLQPAKVDRQLWKRIFTVALDDLTELIAPSQVVFCEGGVERYGNRRNTTFDAEIYRRVLQANYPDTEFVPLGGANDVEKNSLLIGGILRNLFSSIQMWNLLDRDDRSDEEITMLWEQGTRVLRRRDIENYLWDDEILTKLCESVEQNEIRDQVLGTKANLLQEAATGGIPADDIKAISGRLYTEVKKLLGLRQCGNTAQEFAKVTLAPLITPNTNTYKELAADVFGTERKK